MADTESLEIQIGADISQARNNLNIFREQLANTFNPQATDRLNMRILSLGRSIMSSERALERLGAEARTATSQSRGLETIRTADVFNGINTISNAVINLTSKFNILGRVAREAFDIILSKTKDFIISGHEFNKSMETNKIAFEVLLKSEYEAIKLMDKLNTIAAKTPFQLPQLTNMTKGLLSANVQLEAMPYFLTSIGNAAASTDNMADSANRLTRAIRQMLGKGKVLSEEMEQIAETGVQPWSILSKETGKSIAELRKLAEKGMLDVYDTIESLMDGFNKEFPGMMDKMSKTWDGLMSTIKDNLAQFSGLIQKTFQDKFKKYLNIVADNLVYLVNLLKSTNDPILAIQATLEKAFGSDVMQGIITFVFFLDESFKSLKSSIIAIFEAITPVIIGLLKKIAPIVIFITALISGLGKAFAGLPPFVRVLIVVVGVLSSVFIALVPVFVAIGTLVAGLVAAIMAFGMEILIAIGIISQLGLILFSAIGALVVFGIYLYNAWKSSETFRTMVIEQFNIMYDQVSQIIEEIVNIFKLFGSAVMDIFNAVFPYMVIIVGFAFKEMLVSINTFLKVLNGFMQILSGTFSGNWGKVWNGVKIIFGDIFNDIINIGKIAINGIISLINGAISKINSMSSKIPKWLGGGKINIKQIGYIKDSTKVSTAKTKIKTPKFGFLETIKDTFKKISSKIKNFKMPKFKLPTIDTSKPKSLFEGLSKGLDDFGKKAKKTQKQMDKVRKKIADFGKGVISQAQSIMDFGGLFEKVVEKKFSGEKFIKAIQSQISSLTEWKKNLKDIGSRIGENSNLYLKLLSLGPQYASQVKGLASMTDQKLGEYTELFGKKEGLSYEMGYKMEAGKELQNIKNQQLIFNITGNKITEEFEIDLIANKIIQKLKVEGVY